MEGYLWLSVSMTYACMHNQPTVEDSMHADAGSTSPYKSNTHQTYTKHT